MTKLHKLDIDTISSAKEGLNSLSEMLYYEFFKEYMAKYIISM